MTHRFPQIVAPPAQAIRPVHHRVANHLSHRIAHRIALVTHRVLVVLLRRASHQIAHPVALVIPVVHHRAVTHHIVVYRPILVILATVRVVVRPAVQVVAHLISPHQVVHQVVVHQVIRRSVVYQVIHRVPPSRVFHQPPANHQ